MTHRAPAPVLGAAVLCAAWVLVSGCGTADGQDGEVALAQASPPAHSGEPRRLWSGSDFNFFASAPSPDGRWVTEIDWATGDLAVRDLASGALHRLTDKGPWEASADYAEVARFSPDGRRIAYGWYHSTGDDYQIRILDFRVDDAGVPHGSEPRMVHPGGPQYLYWLYGWTSDDRLLAGIYRPDNSTALAFLSIDSGELSVLKSFEWSDAHAALSGDDRLIAYDHPAGESELERDIYLISADGSREIPVVQRPGRDVVLGWVPSDGSLLFHSDASGTPSIWRQPIEGGAPSGPPELVRAGVLNVEPLGFAGDDFYFGSEIDFPGFRFASVHADPGRLVELPTRLEHQSSPDAGRAMDWSPDGEHFVLAVPEGPSSTRMLVMTDDATLVREWVVPFRLLRWMIRWSPDGALVASGQDNRGRAGIFRVELASGEPELLRHFDGESGRLFALSPDGTSLYTTRMAAGSRGAAEPRVEIVEWPADAGLVANQDRVIHRIDFHDFHLGAGHASPLALSPDGAALAFIDPGVPPGISVIPIEGGTPHRLISTEDVAPALVGWGPRGRWLYYLRGTGEKEGEAWDAADAELHRVHVERLEVQKLGVIHDYFGVGGARLHPDGRRIAFRAGRARGEIWALPTGVPRADGATGGMLP